MLITLVVSIISISSAALAAPTPPGPPNPPYLRTPGPPNVTLFNLPAAITPPTGETLQLVYLGFGTASLTTTANSRNPELYMQRHDRYICH
jgi:hypothetical protein